MLSKDQEKKWYALYTRPRTEKKVFKQLDIKGFDAYLPLQKNLKQWSDRKKWVYEPLIKSYVFVKITIDKEAEIVDTDHAVKLIKFDNKPVAIPENQIDLIKKLVDTNQTAEATDEKFEMGDEVEIIGGKLMGYRGFMVEHRGKSKILIRIEGLDQVILVQVPKLYLKKIRLGKKIYV
jgi:transcription antitermination factor NusG